MCFSRCLSQGLYDSKAMARARIADPTMSGTNPEEEEEEEEDLHMLYINTSAPYEKLQRRRQNRLSQMKALKRMSERWDRVI